MPEKNNTNQHIRQNTGRVLTIVLLSIIWVPSSAQVNEESNKLVWIDAYLFHSINERVKVNPGLSYRRNITSESWKQIFFNPVVTFHLNNTLQTQGSLVLAYTDEMENTIFEIRPWQGILVSYPRFRRFSIQHQLRVEERFFFQSGTQDEVNSLRTKYTLQSFIPINRTELTARAFYVWPSMEIFIDLAGSNVEQYVNINRFNLGLGYGFNKYYRFELCFMQQYSRIEKGAGFVTSDRIFRLVNRFTVY